MAAPTARQGSSRLRRLAQGSPSAAPPPRGARASLAEDTAPELERCELCGVPIAPEHRHIVDLSTRTLMCACRACTLLFDRKAAGGGHYRLVPDRRLRIERFRLDDGAWESLRIPVEMAFFFHSNQVGRVVAFYPSPAGATESLLDLEAWRELAAANPVLDEIESDVEALLVHRGDGAGGPWLVPIDDCYDLVGLMRTHWSGLSGGEEVWRRIDAFFAQLDRRAKTVDREGSPEPPRTPAGSAAGDGKEP